MDTHTSRIRRSRVRRSAQAAGLLAGGLMLALLAACGGGGGAGDTTPGPTEPSGTTSATETPSTQESPVPDDSSTPYLDPSLGQTSEPPSGLQTITGTVESGVESGCLILEHDGTVYGIFGSFDRDVVKAGAQVTLRGTVDTGMMSTCQQGTPFVVEEAEPAG